MARMGDKIIILLDRDYLLSFDELSGLTQFDFESLYEQAGPV